MIRLCLLYFLLRPESLLSFVATSTLQHGQRQSSGDAWTVEEWVAVMFADWCSSSEMTLLDFAAILPTDPTNTITHLHQRHTTHPTHHPLHHYPSSPWLTRTRLTSWSAPTILGRIQKQQPNSTPLTRHLTHFLTDLPQLILFTYHLDQKSLPLYPSSHS